MDQLYTPPPPQGKRKRIKSIFDDDDVLIQKGHAYFQLYQEWQLSRAAGDGTSPPLPAVVAQKLKISVKDAEELREFCQSGEFGEFAADHVRNTPHISLDLNGNEIPPPVDPFGFGEC